MGTINEVARRAGVSVATVSRVINKSGAVAEETREKILKVIDELGYSPNGTARNLRKRRTNIVVVILHSITNTFFSKVVRGIEETGGKKGYNVLLCTTGGSKEREMVYLNMVKARQADGVIFMNSALSDKEMQGFGEKYPAVLCGEHKRAPAVPYVGIDDVLSAYKMTRHLIDCGHKKIALISAQDAVSAAMREHGYKSALERAGLEPYIEYGNYSYTNGYSSAERVVENGATAIFAISDVMALGAVRACMDKGYKIPDDIAVAGFDNILFSHIFEPELTTIAQPRFQMGEKAMELLYDQIENEITHQENVILEHTLIVRQSTIA